MADGITNNLLTLSDSDIRSVATALRTGRLCAPFNSTAVGRFVTSKFSDKVAGELQAFVEQEFSSKQIATLIDLLIIDRRSHRKSGEAIDVVTSGPEESSVANRDTSVVVREMFANAKESVLVAGYAVYQGQQVFRALAEKMDELSSLNVRMFLDIQRPIGDSTIDDIVIRRFLRRFKTQEWPAGKRLPDLFYDPRSLQAGSKQRACLHAKCIVVDHRIAFVSSANFTEAAQERNIEVGLLVRSPAVSRQLTTHFGKLLEAGLLQAAQW